MLARQFAGRLAAPMMSRQTARAAHATVNAAAARSSNATLTHATPAFSTCAVHRSEAARFSAGSSTGSSSSYGSESASATPASLAVSPLTAATLALAVVGAVSYALSESSSEVEAASAAALRLQLRTWAARYGLSAAECDAAAADLPPKLVSSARGPAVPVAVSAAPIVGDDEELASFWRRLVALLADHIFMQTLIMMAQILTNKIRPGVVLVDSPGKSLLATGLLMFVMDLVGTLYLGGHNGVGKWLTGLRTVRLDREPVDAATAVKLGSTRLLAGPVALFVEPLSLFSAEARQHGQLMHNYASGTIVVRNANMQDYE